ncbi:MAG: transporter ATP-binding protein [Homoserinimonas sp.]|jgi:peptide/nickel transport system ATP-binding protein|nr:transporter ATP-binding protein [Homoserinimonas sp.]
MTSSSTAGLTAGARLDRTGVPSGIVPVVSAHDLSVHYRTRDAASYVKAIDGATFDIAPGEVLGVIGESGSGKSTLALAVAGRSGRGLSDDGIPEICGGSIYVHGIAVRGIAGHARDQLTLRTGYLAQDGAVRLNPRLTVAENVAEPIFQRDRRFNPQEAAQAVASMVDSVHLSLGTMNRLPHELSSGQRQRVALARALILEPSLLVADEPTRGVDATVRAGVTDVIRHLQTERGFSALVVSSDIDVVSRLADRVAVLDRGIIVGLGSLDSLLAEPSHPYLEAIAVARKVHASKAR